MRGVEAGDNRAMPGAVAALVCLVVAIADGDTLTVHCEAQAEQQAQTIKVRLAEIDALEQVQAFGNRSKQALAAMCFQKPAAVKPQTRDHYGRTVARLICDGTDANAEQVRAGMAWVFDRYVTDGSLCAVQDEARAARRGLWADREPVPPGRGGQARMGCREERRLANAAR